LLAEIAEIMNNNGKLTTFIMITALLCLAWSADIRAKDDASACVETGALAYGNWTSTEVGGSVMAPGEMFISDIVPTQEQVGCIDRLKRIHRDSHGLPSSVVFGLLAVSNQRLLEC
jgi:hypothetical protein